jgi:hypothetical protein
VANALVHEIADRVKIGADNVQIFNTVKTFCWVGGVGGCFFQENFNHKSQTRTFQSLEKFLQMDNP